MFESSTRWHPRRGLSRAQVVSVWRREPRVQVYSTVYSVQCTEPVLCPAEAVCRRRRWARHLALVQQVAWPSHSGSPGTRGARSSLELSTWNHLHLNNLQHLSQIYIHIHAQIWAAHTMNMAWKDLNPFKKPDMTAAGSSFRFDLFLSPQSHKEPSKKILLVFACSVSVQYSVVYYSRSVVRACLVCIQYNT